MLLFYFKHTRGELHLQKNSINQLKNSSFPQTRVLWETFPPFSSTSLLVSYNSIILSEYQWHDMRLKKKTYETDRKIHHAYKTQKPKLYEHIMQIDKYSFTTNIKVWTVNIYEQNNKQNIIST